MKGVCIIANIQLNEREIINTVNKDDKNSPAAFGDILKGRKAKMATAVAPSNGSAVFFAVFIKALFLSIPDFKSTKIPSATTMALSTNIPIARIIAANETRCRGRPMANITIKVPMMVKTKPLEISKPERSPIANISTTITIPTDTARFNIKFRTASSTRSG